MTVLRIFYLTFKVRRACICGMKMCLLVLDVAPYKGKSSKIASMLLKEENICSKMVSYTLYLG